MRLIGIIKIFIAKKIKYIISFVVAKILVNDS